MKKLLWISFLLFSCEQVIAIKVTGKVVDKNNNNIAYATIAALDADSTILAGDITNNLGEFLLDTPSRTALLRISYIGYITHYINLNNAKDSIVVTLQEESLVLDELTITIKKSLVERKMDRIVLNVSHTGFAIGNNGKDILKKAPGVNIDRKGNVTINGKTVEVYIDGRPTYLSGEQLKSMLEATDGSTIDKLEIITQPSSKYEAAGQGGIINIKTKKIIQEGSMAHCRHLTAECIGKRSAPLCKANIYRST